MRTASLLAASLVLALALLHSGCEADPEERVPLFAFGTGGLSFDDPVIGAVKVGITSEGGVLRLTGRPVTFHYIWIANSSEGTISKLDTLTGVELGRYRTTPEAVYGDPSRTTVDVEGNVWVGNRGELSIAKVGLLEAHACVDRDGNGQIDTSQGGQDVKPWPAEGSPADECILRYVKLSAPGVDEGANKNVRMVAVDRDNNVFAGGFPGTAIFKVDGRTGAVLSARTLEEDQIGGGAYGGFVDGQGNLWTVSRGHEAVYRHDGANTTTTRFPVEISAYGIAPDLMGNLWLSSYSGDQIAKVRRSDGAVLGLFPAPGKSLHQGIATDNDGNVFVAGMNESTVLQFKNDGTLVRTIELGPEGSGPTGVAIDSEGKVWTANRGSGTASRIDPATGTVEGTYPVGSGPYNYSDMTGKIVRGVTELQGTWTAVLESEGSPEWDEVQFTLGEKAPEGTAVRIRARAADAKAGLGAKDFVTGVSAGKGRFLQVEVKLVSDAVGKTPAVAGLRLFAR